MAAQSGRQRLLRQLQPRSPSGTSEEKGEQGGHAEESSPGRARKQRPLAPPPDSTEWGPWAHVIWKSPRSPARSNAFVHAAALCPPPAQTPMKQTRSLALGCGGGLGGRQAIQDSESQKEAVSSQEGRAGRGREPQEGGGQPLWVRVGGVVPKKEEPSVTSKSAYMESHCRTRRDKGIRKRGPANFKYRKGKAENDVKIPF